jgi:hypothetical protein
LPTERSAKSLWNKEELLQNGTAIAICAKKPFNVKIAETPVTFCYGEYRIKFGGRTFYR